MGQIFKILPGETSDLYANGAESSLPKCFTNFGRPMAKNYESVFLTIVRPNGTFDLRATRKAFKDLQLMAN